MTTRAEIFRMNIFHHRDELQKSERCLSAQEIGRLDGIRTGETILCTNGVLWITIEGFLEDYLLRRGEEFTMVHPGLVLVQALNESACWRLLKHGTMRTNSGSPFRS
jgi:hypothetical protein